MPKVTVKGDSPYSAKETFDKISNLLNKDGDLRKLDPAYKCEFDPNAMTGSASGSQFKANMSVKPQGDKAVVEIVVDLPFHLALVKGMVERTLQAKLDKTLS